MVKHRLTPGMSQRQIVSAWNIEKGQLLLMLYDNGIRCMHESVRRIDAGDVMGKSEQLIRAQDIVLQPSDVLEKNAVDTAAWPISTDLNKAIFLHLKAADLWKSLHRSSCRAGSA